MGIETLEKIFTSEVAIFVVLAIAIIYQESRIRAKDREIKEMNDRTIRLLELRNAALSGQDQG